MIEVNQVSKSFGSTQALEGISLRVKEGELFGVVGPNGAGKTTLLRCLVGLLQPREGNVRLDGLDRRTQDLEIKRFSAYLPSNPHVYPNFTARRWMKMMADIYGVPADVRDERTDQLLRMFDLTEIADKRVAFYSDGQYKKTAVCGVLVTGVRLYLLDEPFTGGIDPSGHEVLKEVLRGFREDKDTTVVYATQILELAEQVCTRIAILDRAKLIAVGTVEELQQQAGASEPSLSEIYAKLVGRDFAEAAKAFLEKGS